MKLSIPKFIAALSIMAVLSSVVACGGNKDISQKQPGTVSDENVETVTYWIFRKLASPNYPENGGEARQVILKKLEEAGIRGVDYKVTMVAGAEYDTKLNLMISSGEVPDIFNVKDPATSNRFADEGITLALDDLLKNAPNYTATINKVDLDLLRYNGKLYTLPNGYRPEPFNGPNTSGWIIRLDWLESLNLKVPDTLNDYYNVMKAFTEKDPDKNGKQDTFGFTCTKDTEFGPVFGAFGIHPKYWFERDGKLKQGLALPEAKEALKVLQTWYKEGLIDSNFPIMERKQMQEKVINSKAGIFAGDAFTPDYQNNLHASLRKVTSTAKLDLIPPPAGSKGLRGYGEEKPGDGIRVVSAKTKHPERLIKLIDWASTEAGSMALQFGIEGVDYTYDKAKNKIQKMTESEAVLSGKGFGNPARFVNIVDRRWMSDIGLKALETAGKHVIRNAFWKSVPAMFDYPDLDKLFDEYMINIITGSLPVDAWDEYVRKYYQQGGKVIEDQVNEEWKKNK